MTNPERLQTNIVGPAGNLRARMVFIGEAPGETENIQGKPFVGTSGQLLRRCFVDKGISIHEVLFHNCFQQRPPNNDVGYYFKDSPQRFLTWEGQEHVEALRSWLTDVQADGYVTVVIALGATALRILTGKRRIAKWRGSCLPCTLVPGLKVYATFHPSYVQRCMNEPEETLMGEKKLRIQNAMPLFLVDLERIIYQSEFPELRIPHREQLTTLRLSELLYRLEQLNNEPLVAVDIETLPGHETEGPLLWCIGFSSEPGLAFIVPFIENQHPAWPIEQEAQLHQAVSKVFLNPRVQKVFHLGAYDLSVLGRYYGYRVAKGTQEDTALCHQASYPYLYKYLHVLTSIYTDEPYYKDEGKALGSRGDQAEFKYCCKDNCVTREILPIVHQHARELNTFTGYQRTMRVQPSLLGMMIQGVRIDIEKKKDLAIHFAHEVSFHEEEIFRLAGKRFNLNSSSQKQAYLYGHLGLKIQTHLRTKKATTDKDALNKLVKLYPKLEVLPHFLERSKYHKLSEDYAEMEIEPDGRVRTSYKPISTWRLSSSESHFGGGGNLQNIPARTVEGKKVRELFITDKLSAAPPRPWPEILAELRAIVGDDVANAYEALPERRQIMFARDLRQAEAQVVAWEADDKTRIELFRNGWDVHWHGTSLIFSIPKSVVYCPATEKDVFTDPITNEPHTLKELRNIGKTVEHAGNYGMGPSMLATILARVGIIQDFMTCRKMLMQRKARNPLTLEWQRKIREKVSATRMLTSSYGRVRYFMGRLNESLYKSAYAFSPQNTVGELLCESIEDIFETVPKANSLLNVHDEVVGQCNPWDLRSVLIDTKPCLERPFEINGQPICIGSDVKVGVSWGELHEISEPAPLT